MPDLVQCIAVARSGTHEQVVRAVAAASVRAWLTSPDDPAWAAWLSGRFVKSVRRGRPAELARARPLAASEVHVGDAVALGFAPTLPDGMPKVLAKMQVSGTDMERTGNWGEVTAGPLLVQNPLVEMSTGKTAAQAAHALFLWALTLDADARARWVADDAPFQVTVAPDPAAFAAVDADVQVRDAGFTEISAGTTTFKVVSGHGS